MAPVEATTTAEPGWANEVDTDAVPAENWADEVAAPAPAAIPPATAAPAFQTGGDWASQVYLIFELQCSHVIDPFTKKKEILNFICIILGNRRMVCHTICYCSKLGRCKH